MSKSDIISVPDTRLRQTSSRIGIITEETQELIARMEAATLDWEASRTSEVGVALAAVQIGTLERVVIIRSNPDDKKSRDFEVFINPKITKYEGNIVDEPEGCLSIPDIYAYVPRHDKVRISALDARGNEVRLKASGFLARVFQHEIDHLHGKLFTDHVTSGAFYNIMKDGELEPINQADLDANRVLWDC